MSTTTPWHVRWTASPSELHGPRRLRHGTPRFPRPYSQAVVGGPLRPSGARPLPSLVVGRPFQRSNAVTPSTPSTGRPWLTGAPAPLSRKRRGETPVLRRRVSADRTQCLRNGACTSSSLPTSPTTTTTPVGAFASAPNVQRAGALALRRLVGPTNPALALAVAAFRGRPGCVFRGLVGVGGGSAVRRAACCPAPAFWAPCSLLPCACFWGFAPPPKPAPLGRLGEVKPLLPQPPPWADLGSRARRRPSRLEYFRVFRVRELAGRSGSSSETPPLNPPRR